MEEAVVFSSWDTSLSVHLLIKTYRVKATALGDHLIFPRWAREQPWPEPFRPSGVFSVCIFTEPPLIQIVIYEHCLGSPMFHGLCFLHMLKL